MSLFCHIINIEGRDVMYSQLGFHELELKGAFGIDLRGDHEFKKSVEEYQCYTGVKDKYVPHHIGLIMIGQQVAKEDNNGG